MLQGMSTAWDRAQKSLLKAQKQQKKQHDKAAKNSDFLVGDRVFVCMPAMKTGPLRKLSRPYKGPYRVISTYPNGVKVHPINQPRAEAIRVALNRVRRCPEEIQDCDGAERPSVMATQGMPQDDQYQGDGSTVDTDGEQVKSDATTTFSPNAQDSTWGTRLRPRKISSRMT